MNETNMQETTPDIIPDDAVDIPELLLDDDTLMESGTGTDTGDMESESITESEDDESVDVGDSTTYVFTYTEEQQQADSELIGGINQLNVTCTLILFFLLFAWAEKKVRFCMKGFTNGKFN